MVEYKVTIYGDGSEAWHNMDGYLHRENGPARIDVGNFKMWYRNGLLHREDGPAIEYSSGVNVYYIDGNHIAKELFDRLFLWNGKVIESNNKKFTVTEIKN